MLFPHWKRVAASHAILAAVAAPAAFAQVGTSSTAAADQADASGRVGISDIVVTAQRRSQNQQDVPIAVTTLTAETAQQFGTGGTDSLTLAVPSLQFSNQGGVGGAPFLRGVGSSETSAAEASVATYIDDVYVGGPTATLFKFNNVESVEVLKGPQGTLFGRNATGGVVNIHTRNPTHEPHVDAQVGWASYDTLYGSFYGTTGLSDTLSANLAVIGRDQSKGYGKNLSTGEDIYKGWYYGLRGKLLWEPSDRTSLVLTGDFYRENTDVGENLGLAPGTTGLFGTPAPTERFRTANVPNDLITVKNWSTSGKLTHDLDFMRLISITSYRNTREYFGIDLDADPVNYMRVDAYINDRASSQEFQLQSPEGSDKFSWIMGAFYYDSRIGYEPQRLSGAIVPGLFAPLPIGSYRDLNAVLKLKSYAAFADATFAILPETNVTAGIRYTRDRYTLDWQNVGESGFTFGVPRQSKTFSKPTWRAVLDHHFTRDIMAYASYSRGFKSGRFNISDAAPIRPETLDAYEVGVKSELFNRMVRLNIAAFHYDYKDIQVTTTTSGLTLVTNAGKARINGLDLDLTFAPTRNLNIVGGLSVLDAKYTAFPNGPLNVANPADCGGPGVPPHTIGTPTGGFTACPADLAGNRLSRAPKIVMNLSATYTIPTSIGDFELGGSVYRNWGFFWEPDNNIRQPRYTLVNANLTWRSPDRRYDIRVYGKNLLNEYYYNFHVTTLAGQLIAPEMPDNYGAEFTVHF